VGYQELDDFEEMAGRNLPRIFGGSGWNSSTNMPNSGGAGSSPLRPRSSARFNPAALTFTRTQVCDGSVGLGYTLSIVKHFDGGVAPGDDNTAAIIVPLGLLSHEDMVMWWLVGRTGLGSMLMRMRMERCVPEVQIVRVK
jgi:hypothetical protein